MFCVHKPLAIMESAWRGLTKPWNCNPATSTYSKEAINSLDMSAVSEENFEKVPGTGYQAVDVNKAKESDLFLPNQKPYDVVVPPPKDTKVYYRSVNSLMEKFHLTFL